MIIEIDKGINNVILFSYPEYESLEVNYVKVKAVFEVEKWKEIVEKAPKTVEEWPSLPKIETCIKENFFRFSSKTMVRRFFFRHDIDFYTENQDESIQQIEIYRRKETVSDIFLTDCPVRLLN